MSDQPRIECFSTASYRAKYAKRKSGRNMAYPPGGGDVIRLCDEIERIERERNQARKRTSGGTQMNSDTTETDGLCAEHWKSVMGWPQLYSHMTAHARKLERERDDARKELAELARLLVEHTGSCPKDAYNLERVPMIDCATHCKDECEAGCWAVYAKWLTKQKE